MTGTMNVRRCGGCFFAKISPQVVAQDITKRICYGAPPHAHPVQVTGGKWTMQMIRPVVSVSEDACALYYSKTADDMKREAEDFKEIEQMHATEQAEQAAKEAYSGMRLDIKQ